MSENTPSTVNESLDSLQTNTVSQPNESVINEEVATMKFGTMGELREKAPEVWNEMVKSMAQNMIRQIDSHSRRLKKIHEEGRK
ncbi:MAG: hypothetical protein CMO81_11470 [Waddliaceae bacterium]|nr:hypothetical protein [Waddliaceae bacterium]